MKTGEFAENPTPLWVKLAFVMLSSMVFMGGYVVYQTIEGKPALFPMYFSKVVPLDKAEGVDKIDMETLKTATKETLLSNLSMNSDVRLLFGLPLQLGDFQKFYVGIEYKHYIMSGLQVDCTKSWFHPQISWKRREVVSLPTQRIEGIFEPLKNGADGDYDPLSKEYQNQRDYSILLDGRIAVLDNENTHVDNGTGAITYTGIIEFDHTKTIKITNVIVSYRKDGVAKVKKLW